MVKRYKLEVEVLEDLHSGTGTGGGKIDAVQIRDRRGRPVIRASHLKGLWRAAAKELVELAGPSGSVPRNEMINKIIDLFGAPGANQSGSLVIRSLRTDETKTISWSSTARKPYDRGPQHDTLRTIEHVPAGTKFTSEIELLNDSLEGLFKKCVKRTNRLGASRSRGVGLIRAVMSVANPTAITKLVPPSKNMLVLRLVLINLEPLCLATTGVPGNIINSAAYISGQVLRGAFGRWALRRSKSIANLLQDDKVSMGNALPIPLLAEQLGLPAAINAWDVAPIPLNTKTFKPGPQNDPEWPWWADDTPQCAGASDFEADRKRPGDSEFIFRATPTDPWQRYRPIINLHLRNQAVSRHNDKPELFSNEEIAEDTLFVSDIIFENHNLAAGFQNDFSAALNGSSWLTVGRGGAPVQVLRASWIQIQRQPVAPVSKAHAFTITLQSDLIARGPHLGFFDTLDPMVLVELCFTEKERIEPLGATWEWKAVTDTVEVRGFNPVSGLPRTPTVAIRRGSHLSISEPEDACRRLRKKLSAIEALGERNYEGFGRFRLDFVTDDPQPISDAIATTLSLARSEELIKDAVELSKLLLVPKHPEIKTPTATQWMALWQTVQTETTAEDILRVLTQLQVVGKRPSGEAWRSVRFDLLEAKVKHYSSVRPSSTWKKPMDDARFFIDVVVRQFLRQASSESQPQ